MGRRAARYVLRAPGGLVHVAAAASAVERDKRGGREGGLADGALRRGRALLAKPLVYAGPAVEVAAKSHHRLHGEVEADVTVEASVGGRRREVQFNLARRFLARQELPLGLSVHRISIFLAGYVLLLLLPD